MNFATTKQLVSLLKRPMNLCNCACSLKEWGAVRAVTFALHINEHWPLPASRLSFLNSDAVHWCKPVFDFFFTFSLSDCI